MAARTCYIGKLYLNVAITIYYNPYRWFTWFDGV